MYKKEISWINSGRAICMCCVYLFHAEFYYGIGNVDYSYFFTPFFMTFFFFVSGYLMLVPDRQIDVRHKMVSLLSKLLWPYFIFTTLIWIPKMMKHGKSVDFMSYLVDVFGGTASWFVTALIVAELLILLASYVIKDSRWYIFLGICTFALSIALGYSEVQYWNYKSGMMAVLFMALGGLYRYYQEKLSRFVSWKCCICVFLVYITVRLIDFYTFHYTSSIAGVHYDSISLGLFENLSGITFLLLLVQLLPSCSWFDYIGKYSLSFYFLSGGCPTIVGMLFQHVFPNKNYVITILVALVSISVAYVMTKFIEKKAPFMLDAYWRRTSLDRVG